VYAQSGSPTDNGWFLTEDGKSWLEINGETGEYYARKYLEYGGDDNIANFSTPRILRFGILVEY